MSVDQGKDTVLSLFRANIAVAGQTRACLWALPTADACSVLMLFSRRFSQTDSETSGCLYSGKGTGCLPPSPTVSSASLSGSRVACNVRMRRCHL